MRRSDHGTLTSALGLIRLLVTLRLVAPDAAEPASVEKHWATAALVARAVALPDWAATVAALDAARQEVRRFWTEVTGGDGNDAA